MHRVTGRRIGMDSARARRGPANDAGFGIPDLRLDYSSERGLPSARGLTGTDRHGVQA